ncbi:MAG: ROK family protein [Bacteroidales bacterium]|nr:ROK family protein [Bacteroidales bacterium]MBQ6576372.1 ROK family protein [Bacteroidales bacterium]
METFLNSIHGRYASDKKTILGLCMNNYSYALSDLARELGTSIPKITRIVTEMVNEGYLVEVGKLESASGRRPSLYGLNPDAGFFVGVDVNKDFLIVSVTNFPGRQVALVDNIPYTLESTESSVKGLCKVVLEAVRKEKIDPSRVRGYGVNLTGRVNRRTGYSYSYYIGEEKPIAQLLEEGFGQKVIVENDSRAMAYGEYMAGVAGNADTFLFLNVGWGLGMGMVIDGKLFYGKSGFSGEVGHFPLLDNNRVCQCGKMGCLETGASGSALHRIVLEKLSSGRSSILSSAYRKGEEISLDSILEAVEKEDVLAIECVEEIGSVLGRAVAGLINIFNPDLVVIGGRLSSTERYLMPPLRSAVNRLSLNLVNSDTQIKVSSLGKSAGAVGASFLSKSRLLSELS